MTSPLEVRGVSKVFARELSARLRTGGLTVADTVQGQPADARRALERIAASGAPLEVIAANQTTASWTVLTEAGTSFPALREAKVVCPRSYR